MKIFKTEASLFSGWEQKLLSNFDVAVIVVVVTFLSMSTQDDGIFFSFSIFLLYYENEWRAASERREEEEEKFFYIFFCFSPRDHYRFNLFLWKWLWCCHKMIFDMVSKFSYFFLSLFDVLSHLLEFWAVLLVLLLLLSLYWKIYEYHLIFFFCVFVEDCGFIN